MLKTVASYLSIDWSIGTFWKFVAGLGSAGISYFFGSWTTAIQALFIFVLVDYTTGFAAAVSEKNLSSRVGFRGICQKAAIFVVVALCHLADEATGSGTDLFRDGAVAFYLVNESLSIVENLGRLGVKIPDQLRDAINVLKGSKNKKEKDGE